MVLIRWLLMLMHLAVCLLLFGTFLNAHIAPQTFGFLNLLSLSYPILLIIHVVLTLVWLVLRKKRVLLFIAISFFLITPTRRIINYSSPSGNTSNLKVLSYNSKSAAYAPEGSKDPVKEFIESEDPDIVLLQEDRTSLEESKTVKESGAQIYTKHRIINSGTIITDGSNSHGFYADIEIDGKILRVINVYLQPFKLQKHMVRPTSDAQVNKEKAKRLIFRFVPTFKAHQSQVQQIQSAVENSPYPVVLGGDFNSVPNSWEYYQFSEKLVDAFTEVGNGSGTSFHDYKFPIRIDYIFSSTDLKPVRYEVDRTVHLSDHFPVIAEFQF